jgi:hypothetical protein
LVKRPCSRKRNQISDSFSTILARFPRVGDTAITVGVIFKMAYQVDSLVFCSWIVHGPLILHCAICPLIKSLNLQRASMNLLLYPSLPILLLCSRFITIQYLAKIILYIYFLLPILSSIPPPTMRSPSSFYESYEYKWDPFEEDISSQQ